MGPLGRLPDDVDDEDERVERNCPLIYYSRARELEGGRGKEERDFSYPPNLLVLAASVPLSPSWILAQRL